MRDEVQETRVERQGLKPGLRDEKLETSVEPRDNETRAERRGATCRQALRDERVGTVGERRGTRDRTFEARD